LRIWVDITNSPHVPFFRPLLERLREQGHDVDVTARSYAQTLELLALNGITATAVGSHGGRSRVGKARAEAVRLPALRRFARERRFDLALAHGSHDLTLVARSLRVPSVTAFDYEFAWLQHQLGCRAATRVVVPEAIPPDRLERYGVHKTKLLRYPGLKEEYYLADFEPDHAILERLGLDTTKVIAVLRTPPEVSLYHRHGNPRFRALLERLGRDSAVQAVVLPRTREQRDSILGLRLPALVVPEHAVDAQSLVAFADLVVSAGGTINREAVALGVPVFSTFEGRLGAVDEQLLREGRLQLMPDPAELALRKRSEEVSPRIRRDPSLLVELFLSARDGS
jgi:predicted glycosyltransferase